MSCTCNDMDIDYKSSDGNANDVWDVPVQLEVYGSFESEFLWPCFLTNSMPN